MRRSHHLDESHVHSSRDLSDFPTYAQNYPSLARHHLCDVKRSTYYPCQPTLRHIDRDNVMHKLPDEHCRNTALCGPECFDAFPEKVEGHGFIRRDFCIDKLLQKYSLQPKSLRNVNFEILKICPSERHQFKHMCCQHQSKSFCVKYDPSLVRRQKDNQEEMQHITCCLQPPWN